MVKKEGKYPCNSRVDVDYSSGKPKIQFTYPSKNPKKDAIDQGGLTIFLILIWIIIGIIPFFVCVININSKTYDPPSFCEDKISLDMFNASIEIKFYGDINDSSNKKIFYSKVNGYNLTCDEIVRVYKFNKDIGKFYEEDVEKSFLMRRLYFIFLLWMYISIVPSFLLYRLITNQLIKKKWYQKWLPKANAEGIIFKRRNKKYSKFTSKDVHENVIVIPYFNNIELDYKTNGDFSKKLKKIKIREYRNKTINIKSKKIGKEKVDKFKWYAIFYFKDKPKDGYLEVIYQ
jgi:hypothetical protein